MNQKKAAWSHAALELTDRSVGPGLEGEDDVEDLLSVTGLLDIA